MTFFTSTHEKTFRRVFEQIFFPYLAVDLARLRDALREDPRASTAIAIPLGTTDPDRRPLLLASMAGLLSKVTVPDEVISIIARSAPIQEAGLSQAFLEIATSPGSYLTTSASRRPAYDYDALHFALRHFLELKLLARSDAADQLRDWQAGLASPICEIDYALMALAQHYGLPSHGLDITTSLEVGVWFATNLLEIDSHGRAGYRVMAAADWPEAVDDWPVVFVHQVVTHSLRGSLHDCHELDAFGFEARRPARQQARFFLGGHSDHQNRIAESVVCVLRLRPGEYSSGHDFDQLFPSPDDDPGYRIMLEFGEFAGLGGDVGVLRFHAA